MKLSSLWIPCLLLVAPLQVPASSFTLAVDKSTDKPGVPYSQFSVQENTQIPGATLKPGSYNIRIVDHLSDRMVLRVERDGKAQATFLALPGTGRTAPDPSVLVLVLAPNPRSRDSPLPMEPSLNLSTRKTKR